YHYDGGQIDSILHQDSSGATLAYYSYIWDTASRLTSKTEGGTTTRYGYDPTGQLTQAGSQTYTYDHNGNPTWGGDQVGTDNELASDGTWAYSYDAAGDLTGKTDAAAGLTWAYGYDDANELTSAVETDSNGNVLVQAS